MRNRTNRWVLLLIPTLIIALCSCQESRKSSTLGKPLQEVHVEQLEMVSPSKYIDIENLRVEAGLKLTIIGNRSDSIYWEEMEKGAKQAVEDINYMMQFTGDDKVQLEYLYPMEEDIINDQVNLLEKELNHDVDALAIALSDSKVGMTQFDFAKDCAIPVVVMDSQSVSEHIATTCLTDNYAVGKMAAEKMIEANALAGELLVVCEANSYEAALQRKKGFMETIEEKAPGTKVLVLAEAELQQHLETNSNITGMFVTSGDDLEYIQLALAERMNDIYIIGMDIEPEQVNLLEDGLINGLLVQNPYGMGYTSVIAMIRAIEGKELPEHFDCGFIWVTKENMHDEEIERVMY